MTIDELKARQLKRDSRLLRLVRDIARMTEGERVSAGYRSREALLDQINRCFELAEQELQSDEEQLVG